MGFWIFMMLTNLLIPLMMIGFGRYFMNGAPQDINALFGYRTRRSMQSRSAWDFAHRYFGRLWYLLGIIILPLTVIAMLFVIKKDINTIGMYGGIICMVQALPLIGAIFPTERALRRNFDK